MTETDRKQIKEALHRIASELGERDAKPRRQIARIIEMCGLDFAEQLLEETRQIEAQGGMMIASGERRRTAGGVFFHLAREKLPEEIRDNIFYNWKVALKRRRAFEAQFPVFDYADRMPTLQPVLQDKGVISEVKVSLMGRPGAIERRQNLVITSMEYKVNEPHSLPGGVPEPPTDPMTYVVYISSKQWDRVAQALEDNADDDLVVEGMCAYDPQVEGFAVFTTTVTTRLMQKQEKRQQKQNGKKKYEAKKQENEARAPKGKPARSFDPEPENQSLQQPAPEPNPGPPPPSPIELPEGVPPEVGHKLHELTTAADKFRQKIATLEAKPADQQFGLDMTRKLLQNTERQIDTLKKQHNIA